VEKSDVTQGISYHSLPIDDKKALRWNNSTFGKGETPQGAKQLTEAVDAYSSTASVSCFAHRAV
jgi:hypothetical protein